MQTPEDKDKETKKAVEGSVDQGSGNTVDENIDHDDNDDELGDYQAAQFDEDLYSVDDYDVDFDATTSSMYQKSSSGGSSYKSPIDDVSMPEIDIKGLREEYSSFASSESKASERNTDGRSAQSQREPSFETSHIESNDVVEQTLSRNEQTAGAGKRTGFESETSDVLAVHAVMREADDGSIDDYPEELNLPPVGSLGSWLQESRKDGHMEVEEVASRLRITPDAVKAIESNDFDTVGAPVFVRGYVRNYAKLLGLPVEQVLEKYNAAAEAPPKLTDPVASVKSTPEPKLINIPYGRIISFLLLLLPLYFAYHYLPWSQWFANLQTEAPTGETDEIILPPEELPAIDSNALINSDDTASEEKVLTEEQRIEAESGLGEIVIEDILNEGASGSTVEADAIVTDETLALALGDGTNVSNTPTAENPAAEAGVVQVVTSPSTSTELVAAANESEAVAPSAPAPIPAAVQSSDINSFLEAEPSAAATVSNGESLVDVPKPAVEESSPPAAEKPPVVAADRNTNNATPKRTKDGKVVKTFTQEELLGGVTPKPTAVQGNKVLVFNFTGKCWAQVTEIDSGKVILARTLSAGQVRTIKSSKKLKVVLGNPGAVRLTVNGKRRSTNTNGSGVARFEL